MIFWSGWPYHRATLGHLRHQHPHHGHLVTLGTVSAWLWSIVALVFFDAGSSGMESMVGMGR